VLLTVGHGTADRAELLARLAAGGVEAVVDVRRFPGSRLHPDVRREALEQWLPAAGVGYRWEPRLGGRRTLRRGEPVEDPWWTVEAFRAYAAHTRSEEFADGWAELRAQATTSQVAVLCSEAVWWRCHRRLVADVGVLAGGLPVTHLLPGGRRAAHVPSAGARLREDGQVVWDVLLGQG
jgi:uncharacterized protein (DUF488 family)